MAFEWKDVGKTIAKVAPLVATAVGTAVGGPLGPLAGGVTSALCSLFGIDATDPAAPEQLNKAIQTDPEAALKLREFEIQNKTELEKLAIERDRIHLQHEAEIQQTARVEAQSTDEYVRRTRPGLLRKHFWFVACHTFAMLIIYGLLVYKSSESLFSTFQTFSGDLWDMYKVNFGSFTINYGGYTAVRSIWDKRDKEAPGPVEKVAGVLWGKKR